MNREILQKALDALDIAQSLLERSQHYDQVLNAYTLLQVELAKSKQAITQISSDQYETLCFTCGACLGKPWVGLTDKEIKGILDCGSDGLIDIKKAEQTLKDKNT